MRGVGVLCRGMAAAAAKPARTTLYCKAGPGGDGDLGDCPFAHAVQMCLTLKGADYDVSPVTQASKPGWLLDEAGGKLPCVLHAGEPHVETADIMRWADGAFPGPPLAAPDAAADAVRAAGVFPAIAGYTKNTDEGADPAKRAALTAALERLAAHLGAHPGGFAAGAAPTLADCDLAPKLYVLQHATKRFKGFDLAEECFAGADVLRAYVARAHALPAFAKGKYPEETGCWGWGQARGGR